MFYLSSLLTTTDKYAADANRLLSALSSRGVEYRLLDGTYDIWLRDFMPVRTKSGKYVSFRYEPSYLAKTPKLRTDYRREIAPNFPLENLVYSDINLDGGNIVFSPSGETAVISERIFAENPEISPAQLVQKLEQLLETRVIIIPADGNDMTGHADGMVRFLDEQTVLGNCTPYKHGLEQRISQTLQKEGIQTVEFPYFSSPKGSAVGCYINYLETDVAVFLPVFDNEADSEAIHKAEQLFSKPVVPVELSEIAKDGGCLNCISWEC